MKLRFATALAIALASAALAGPGCEDHVLTFPVALAPPSRHDGLRDGLVAEARAFAVAGGDWTEDLGDAPLFGLVGLARRTDLDPAERARKEAAVARADALVREDPLAGDAEERLFAALGLVASGEGEAAVDTYLDRVDAILRDVSDDVERLDVPAIREHGATVVTALVALLHVEASEAYGGPWAEARRERAIALERHLVATTFGDLADPGSGRSTRGFAANPGEVGLTLLPNALMMLVDARLFRATKDDAYRLRARALFAAIQPLLVGPTYAEPEQRGRLDASTRATWTLAGQSALAVALLAVFEVTGDLRYSDEADRVLDGIGAMRGEYCAGARCASGLLHHVADGNLASDAGAGPVFCSGCNLHAAFAVGLRRHLAGQGF